MINLIVCMGENREIGKNNDMPWGRGLPADLAYFKRETSGHTVVMGRKTFESIGKPLPNRANIILTSDRTYKQEGCKIMHDVKSILAMKDQTLFIIGGATLYEQFLPYADFLYITKIKQSFEADTFFPKFNEGEYELIRYQQGKKDKKNQYEHGFFVYKKIGYLKNKTR